MRFLDRHRGLFPASSFTGERTPRGHTPRSQSARSSPAVVQRARAVNHMIIRLRVAANNDIPKRDTHIYT